MKRARRKSIKSDTFPMITVGRVIDTNDPKQMGRIRVLCASLGDTGDILIGDLPWASYVSPLAGFVEQGARGRGDDLTTGAVSYGMWNVPKVGAIVLVACLDGDPRLRVWLGCLHGELMTHTLPHGRFSVRGEVTDVSDTLEDGNPIGPFSSREEAIQPQYDKLQQAFTQTIDSVSAGTPISPQDNFEYVTRGADRAVSRLTEDTAFASNTSFERDDLEDIYTEPDGKVLTSTQGYQKSRVEPNLKSDITGDVYDSQVYSWTTPGFHAIAMDDSSTNCRMRFRTTHGHQIILDDTNERIYISVAGGKCWIEMDEQGNMDFFAERNISFHGEKDINFTAGDTFRVKAKNGIHMVSEGEVRLHAKTVMHIKSDTDFKMQAAGTLHIDSQTALMAAETSIDIKVNGGSLTLDASTTVDVTAGTDGTFDAASNLNLKAGVNGMFDSGGISNILAGGNVLLTGSEIHANGPPASPATPGSSANLAEEANESFWTNRVPEHEPWPRVMTKASITDLDVGNTHSGSAEFTYDDASVGRIERGEDLSRNKNWHR